MLIELLMFNKIYKTSEVMLTTLTIIQSEENRLKNKLAYCQHM